MKYKLLFFLFIASSAPILAQNWTVIDTNITHTTAALNSAFFVDDTTGYVVGAYGSTSGVILKTTDSGGSWSAFNTSSGMLSIYFPSRDTGYAVGYNCTIMKTINAGATWTYQNGHISNLYWANAVCFLNNNVGFVGVRNGPGYAFLKTTDGGINWINDVTDTVASDHMQKMNDSTVYAAYGILSKTTNSGMSWTRSNPFPTGGWGESAFFINDSIGFVTLGHGGGTPCFNYSSLIKTTDAGQTWQETNYDCGYVTSLYFPTSQVGYMLGTAGILGGIRYYWKTTDSGINWYESSYPVGAAYDSTSAYGFDIVCTDANTCYILTNYGTIIKTTNGGGAVGIAEQKPIDKNNLSIYPNPSTNQITIELSEAITQTTTIQIKNTLGQTIKTVPLTKGNKQLEIDISDLAQGFYFVQMQNGNRMISKKFIKQ